MLAQAEIDAMRAQQIAAMPGSAIILRATLAADGMGGMSEAWPAVGTVAARLYPTAGYGSNEKLGGAQLISITDWWLSLPWNADVTASDFAKVDGRLFRVKEVNNTEMWRTALRCKVEAHNEEAAP